MTKEEFYLIAKKMQAFYTTQNFMSNKDTMEAWYSLFKGIPANIMAVAVNNYVLTKAFPPTPADITAELQKLKAGNASSLPTAEEAFAMVRKATRNSTYNSEFEFSKLPKIVQQAVGMPQNLIAWAVMETSEYETVQKSHFVKLYNSLVERERSEERLPRSTRDIINAARNNPEFEAYMNPRIDEAPRPMLEKFDETGHPDNDFVNGLRLRFGSEAPKPESEDEGDE